MASFGSFQQRLLLALARLVTRHARAIVLLSVLMACIGAGLTFFKLKIDTNQDNLISEKQDYHKHYLDYLKRFGDAEYFVVVFEVPQGQKNQAKKALENLTQQIKTHPSVFTEVISKLEWGELKNKALLLLPDKEFSDFETALLENKQGIQKLKNIQNLEDVFNLLLDLTANPQLLQEKTSSTNQGFDFFFQMIKALNEPEIIQKETPSLVSSLLGTFSSTDPEGYLFSQSGKLLFLRVMPVKDYSSFDAVRAPLDLLRSLIDQVQRQHPEIRIGLTGRPVLQSDEMESTGNDSLWASLGSLVGVILLYVLYLKNLSRPFFIMAALLMSLCWTAGFITLTLGHLNLLTVVFAIILIGIGVDYGMHFLLRFLNELSPSSTSPPGNQVLFQHKIKAIETSLLSTGKSIIAGALSTTLAFLTALASNFLGLQELGFIAGMGVIFCLISQLLTLPALLVLFDKKQAKPPSWNPRLQQALLWPSHHPRQSLILLLLIFGLCLPPAWGLRFENNMLKLQDPHLESVQVEKQILEDSGYATWFAAFMTPSLGELDHLRQKVNKLPSVAAHESLLDLIPLNQEERLKKIRHLKTQLEDLTLQPFRPSDEKTFMVSLSTLEERILALADKAFSAGEGEAASSLLELAQSLSQFKNTYLTDPAKAKAHQKQVELKIYTALDEGFKVLTNNLQAQGIVLADLPETLKSRYYSSDGHYILYAYPQSDIWEWNFMEDFISDLRSVDAKVTGAPVGVYESAQLMKKGFFLVGGLTLILVFILLGLEFRSIKSSLLALIPLTLGMVGLVALMGLWDISLNLANFFALPILIGLGIDNGVHLIHRYHESRCIKTTVMGVAPAIILSTLTTMIGFGALSFVRHQGLASFGQIMTLGSLTCLIAALWVVPTMLTYYGER